jgi:hypothetical protein
VQDTNATIQREISQGEPHCKVTDKTQVARISLIQHRGVSWGKKLHRATAIAAKARFLIDAGALGMILGVTGKDGQNRTVCAASQYAWECEEWLVLIE